MIDRSNGPFIMLPGAHSYTITGPFGVVARDCPRWEAVHLVIQLNRAFDHGYAAGLDDMATILRPDDLQGWKQLLRDVGP